MSTTKRAPYKALLLGVFLAISLFFCLSAFCRSVFNQYLPPYAYYAASLATWAVILFLAGRARWGKPVMKWLVPAFSALCLAIYPSVFGKLCSPYHWHRIFLADDMLYRVNTEQPLVALTFDGGPIQGKTEQLLAVLEKHRAHATFFLLGRHIPSQEGIVQLIVKQGHSLGNHTWNHPRACDVSNEELVQELQRTGEAIAGITGQADTLMRPPGGILDPYQGWILTHRKNYRICMWSVQSNDTVYPGENQMETIVPRIVQETKSGDIILMHDWAITPETLDALLTELEKKGLKGVSIPELEEAAGK